MRTTTPRAQPSWAAGLTLTIKVRGPGSNLADHTLLEVTSGGELIIAGGAGNGYCFAEMASASNPSGWAGALKVKAPDGMAIGYILLYMPTRNQPLRQARRRRTEQGYQGWACLRHLCLFGCPVPLPTTDDRSFIC